MQLQRSVWLFFYLTHQCVQMQKKKQTSVVQQHPAARPLRPFEMRWVDSVDLRQILNISRTTLFNWEKDHQLPIPNLLGGKKYYDLLALEKMMEAGQQTKVKPIKRPGKSPDKSAE